VHVLNNTPWVCDCEDLSYWYGTTRKITKWKIAITKRFWKRKYCKKIMAMSVAAKKSILQWIKEKELIEKIEVVHPTVPRAKFNKKKHDKIVLVYAARGFERKGGLDVLTLFKVLRKSFDIELNFIGDVPEKIKKAFSGINGINFFGIQPQEFVYKKFAESDIFLLSSRSDTFPLTLIEAMSYGLPCITTFSSHNFANNEIIDDGRTGFLIEQKEGKKPFPAWAGRINFSQFLEKTRLLIENDSLRKEMSKNAKKEVEEGKFDIRKRNTKLRRIYEECLKA
jgi:glycosyltransferase involved in cell wall biosynthesis